ncbi:hypothetical protein DNTS_028727 [Danionella cerebrum]|uniref:Uncharacterized protein n=1 Tax=Danionella cerebrum TaxID=2873325 RepID=A0A553P9F0_9TELE|nr:hypothetical protein DNTS_028727 [Danionella translucida]
MGMILYLSFPVAMFWISNQAEYFEERVVKRQRELLPPEKLKVEMAYLWHWGDEVNGLQTGDGLPPLADVLNNCQANPTDISLAF